MRTPTRTTGLLALALGSTLLLSACGGTSPEVERRDALNAVVDAANAGNPDAMVAAANDLIAIVNAQSGKDLQAVEVARIRTKAQRVIGAAALIDRDEIEKKALASQSAAADARASAAAAENKKLMEAEATRQAQASRSASAAAEASRSAAASPSPPPTPSPASPAPSPSPSAVPSAGLLPGDDGDDG